MDRRNETSRSRRGGSRRKNRCSRDEEVKEEQVCTVVREAQEQAGGSVEDHKAEETKGTPGEVVEDHRT